MDYNEIERKFQEQKRREFNEYVNRVSGFFFIPLKEAGIFCFIKFLLRIVTVTLNSRMPMGAF